MTYEFLMEEEKWIPLIGRCVIDFAYVEDSFHRVIYSHVKNTQIAYENIKDSFDSQLSLFENIFLANISNSEHVKLMMNNFTAQIKKLRHIRNAIAHNSLGLVFEVDRSGDVKEIGFAIENKTRKNISIDYDKFTFHVSELKACRSILEELMLIFQKSEDEPIISNAIASLNFEQQKN